MKGNFIFKSIFTKTIMRLSNLNSYTLIRIPVRSRAYNYFKNEYRYDIEQINDGSLVIANENTKVKKKVF
ncbi:MAG: hypothetical protein ACI4WF_01620 [Bacilli bacterium]